MFFKFKMKYTINSNTIDIEYIAKGKRKKLQLKNDDKIDMDFFNQLMSANSSKRDAMCDLYKREILKKANPNTISIQPLKLDSEIKPSKNAEKQELTKRKEELERDKANTGEEARSLVKEESKKKDINSLTEDDLNDRERDKDRLKEIQSRYNEIDKVYKMVVSQVKNLDITNVTSVRINEIKELNVETFKKLEEYIGKFDLSDSSRKDLLKQFKKILGFREINDKTLIKVPYLISAIPEMNTEAAIQVRNVIEELGLKSDDSIEAGVLRNALTKDIFKSIQVPLKNALLLSFKDSNEFSENFKKFFKIDQNIIDHIIKNWHNFILSLKKCFHETDEKRKNAQKQIKGIRYLDNLKDFLKDAGYFGTAKVSINRPIMISYQKYAILVYKNENDWEDNLLGKILSKIEDPSLVDYEKYSNTFTKKIEVKGSPSYSINIKYIDLDYLLDFKVKNDYLNDFIKLLSLQETEFSSLKVDDVQLYFNYFPDVQVTNDIKSDIMKKGDLDGFLNIKKKFDKTIKKEEIKQKPKEDSSEEELLDFNSDLETKDEKPSQGLSGKIMIDLDKSDLDEKLNEVIRLLSQMNYNVFTTTPMYKKVKSKDETEKKSKGIDLYDVLNL